MKTFGWIISGSVVVTALDIFLKTYAIHRLPPVGVDSFSILKFALFKNPGIAFNIPAPQPIVILLTCIISVYLAYTAIKQWKTQPLTSAFAIMILLGALNNMLDRLINGFTTDYIILFNRSAINLSDILILLGTVLILSYSDTKESR